MQQCNQQPPALNASDLEQRKRDRYRRVDEGVRDGFLAKGLFGKVYIAEDTTTGEVVAINKQRYPSAEAVCELAFAKVLAGSPSALDRKQGGRRMIQTEWQMYGSGDGRERRGAAGLGRTAEERSLQVPVMDQRDQFRHRHHARRTCFESASSQNSACIILFSAGQVLARSRFSDGRIQAARSQVWPASGFC